MIIQEPTEEAGRISRASLNDTSGVEDGHRGESAVPETGRLVREFLDGQPGTVGTVATWARAVVGHKVWGFQAPEDIVQATLLALVENLREGRFKGGNLRAYARRIAKNMCINNYHQARVRGDHIPFEESMHPPAEARPGEDLERRTLLDQIIDHLSQGCQEIVQLAYIEGFSRREMAERLGISLEAVRVRLFRCMEKARDVLSGQDDIGMERV